MGNFFAMPAFIVQSDFSPKNTFNRWVMFLNETGRVDGSPADLRSPENIGYL